MKKHYTTLVLLSLMLWLVLIPYGNIIWSKNLDSVTEQSTPTLNENSIININGDVSLAEDQNRIHWNPHTTGLTNASLWNVTFKNETEIFLKTTTEEAGHVATGAWWTTSFKQNTKLPLYAARPIRLLTSFRVNIVAVHHQPRGEWLRMALACAVQRGGGSVVYTEMDFWDSPNTLRHPAGNIMFGGNIVYRGGDVVEYKIDQAETGRWKSYSLDLTRYIDSAWSLKPGDMLESVYIVIETIGAAEVTVKVDDLWITML
ncbi:MAG: hypothetical protein QW222_05715 [Candidatus Bathyarchaeia archaeon]